MKREDIQIEEKVLGQIEKHCFSETLVEVGGFLVGEIIDESTCVRAHIPALRAIQADTHLTFGHDTWDDAYKILNKKFSGMQIVGWYHTHPDFGCFLSEYDQFIQKNFFTNPQHLALVVDPIRGEAAWFVGQDNEIIEVAQEKTRTSPKLQSKGEVLEERDRRAQKLRFRLGTSLVLIAIASVTGLVSFSFGQNTANSKMQSQISSIRSDSQAKEVQLQATIDTLQGNDGSVQHFTYEYTVQAGDSTWSIANKYLGDGNLAQKILEWNPELKLKSLDPGMKIKIQLPGKIVMGENPVAQ